ncbi:hypothetical protein BD410DRAFT_846650 [Rickenella mellea]|uniref:Alpha-type protein kinase domain-containing protein n=1 Tax=Rickenella mellea TaxID=50990 RepID=A0A4Y7PFC8_9AGAM|nr:hypothetical protein BD410DRAFT_846650 [Rickenella mellea]
MFTATYALKYWLISAALDSVPSTVLQIPDVAQQMFGRTSKPGESKLILDILDSAAAFQRTASDTRLGLPRTAPPSLMKAAIGGSMKVLKERAQKKEHDLNGGIKIKVSLWKLPEKAKNGVRGKMQTISAIRAAKMFDPKAAIRQAMDDLVAEVSDAYAKDVPTARRLNRQNIEVYSDTKVDFAILAASKLRDGTVNELLQYFISEEIGTKVSLANRHIELRLVFCHEKVHVEELPDDDEGEPPSFPLSPLRPASKRKASVSSAAPSAGPRRPLFSAFRQPSPLFSRSPPLKSSVFTRYHVNDRVNGGVAFTKAVTAETMEIASDWLEGEGFARSNEPDAKVAMYKTGYIGSGLSKRAIYARFEGREYAFMQMKDGYTEGEVEEYLKKEYELLRMGAVIKDSFDQHATNNDVHFPPFYFNFKHSILGELEEDVDGMFRYSHFLATCLLPCGPIDTPIRKFTGNVNLGEARDELSKVIHAFAHFSLVYTRGFLLLCDLQGILDQDNVMCLIDPQCHTRALKPEIYWDLGEKEVLAFKKEHALACKKNRFCERLYLRTLVVESASAPQPVAQEPAPAKPPLRHGFEQ